MKNAIIWSFYVWEITQMINKLSKLIDGVDGLINLLFADLMYHSLCSMS